MKMSHTIKFREAVINDSLKVEINMSLEDMNPNMTPEEEDAAADEYRKKLKELKGLTRPNRPWGNQNEK